MSEGGVLKKIGVVFLVRIFGAFSIFLLNYCVAKRLDSESAGYFFWGFSALTIAGQIALLGMQDVALKYVAKGYKNNDLILVGSISSRLFRFVFGGSILLFLVVVVVGFVFWLIGGYRLPMQWEIALYLAPAIPPMALASLCAYKLQAIGRAIKAIIVLSIAPCVFFLSMLIFSGLSSPQGAAAIYSLSWLLTWGLAIYWWRRDLGVRETREIDFSEMRRMAFPMWVIAMMAVSVNWSGQFISGFLVSPEDVSGYAVALRVAALINFALVAVGFVVAPKIAHLYGDGNIAELKKMIGLVSVCLYLFSIPVFLIVYIFSEELMLIFGADFVWASTLLVILAAGQIVNLVTGPVGYLLTMTGYEKDMRNIYLVSGVLCILSTILLTKLYGIFGTAIATSFSIAIHNVAASIFAYKRTGVSVFPFIDRK